MPSGNTCTSVFVDGRGSVHRCVLAEGHLNVTKSDGMHKAWDLLYEWVKWSAELDGVQAHYHPELVADVTDLEAHPDAPR
jgi:hypothetical protein